MIYVLESYDKDNKLILGDSFIIRDLKTIKGIENRSKKYNWKFPKHVKYLKLFKQQGDIFLYDTKKTLYIKAYNVINGVMEV